MVNGPLENTITLPQESLPREGGAYALDFKDAVTPRFGQSVIIFIYL